LTELKRLGQIAEAYRILLLLLLTCVKHQAVIEKQTTENTKIAKWK
jgi:hypothetical protein